MSPSLSRSLFLLSLSLAQTVLFTSPAFAGRDADRNIANVQNLENRSNRDFPSLVQIKGTLSCLTGGNPCSPQIMDSATGETYRLKTNTALLDMLKDGKSKNVAIEGFAENSGTMIKVSKLEAL